MKSSYEEQLAHGGTEESTLYEYGIEPLPRQKSQSFTMGEREKNTHLHLHLLLK